MNIDKAVYKFVSGIVHVGATLQDGHYICITSCPDGSITSFDDALVGFSLQLCYHDKPQLEIHYNYVLIVDFHFIPLPGV